MVLKYNKLFKPAKIRNLEIKNRIAMVPMGCLWSCNSRWMF